MPLLPNSNDTELSAHSVVGTFPSPGEVGVVAKQVVVKLEAVAELSATAKE